MKEYKESKFLSWWRYSKLRDWYYYTRNLIWDRHHIIKLRNDPTWMDSDTKIELALDKILAQYIEGEEPFEHFDWEKREDLIEVKKFLTDAYAWIKCGREVKQQEFKNLLKEWSNLRFDKNEDFFTRINREETSDEIRKRIEMDKAEQYILDRNNQMYLDIIKYRKYLWT